MSRDVRHLPLFRALSTEEFAILLLSFNEREVPEGEVLFREGDNPTRLQVLLEGEIELTERHEPQVLLRSPAPVGELGALTGVPRNTTATAKTPVRILEAEVATLMKLFATSPAVSLAFYRGLLDVVGDKVRRDRVRLDDMRANIVRTQKRMKELRDVVLASPETPISKAACDALDDLIEHNRRAHYRVAPVPNHPATLRLEERIVSIVELSEGYIKLDPALGLAVETDVSGILALPQGEIAVSGRVVRVGPDGVLLKLDLLIDTYRAALLGYVTQLQLLDLVV